VQFVARRGKGATDLILWSAVTIVRNPKDELKTGTFHAMLTQLGLTARICRRLV